VYYSLFFLPFIYLVDYYLPAFKCCQLAFLQAIVQDKKKALKKCDVGHKTIPHFPEFSTKVLLKDNYLPPTMVEEYFPTNKPENLDRQFVWNVWAFLSPEKANLYYNQVCDGHGKQQLPPKL